MIGRAVRRFLPESSFGRNILKIAGSSALAQAITLAAAPILSRLYTPEAFGVLAIVMGVASTLTVISSLSYEAAIPVPRGNRMAMNAAYLSLAILIFTVVLTFVACNILLPWLPTDVFGDGVSSAWLNAIPAMLLVMGFNQVAIIVALRAHRFSDIASIRIWQSSVVVFLQATLAPLGALALIFGQIIGQLVGAGRLWRSAFSRETRIGVSRRNLTRTMMRYRRFPLFEGPFSLLNSAGNYLPSVFLAAGFGAGVGGLFALAHRSISAPISLVTAASGQVFYASAATANREGTIGNLVEQTQTGIARLIAPLMVLLALSGPDVFALVFGQPWREAGVAASLMTPWIYAQALGSTVSTIWIVQGNVQHGTMIGAVGFVLRLAALLAGFWINDWVVAIAIFSLANTLYYLAVCTYAIIFSSADLKNFLIAQVRIFLLAAMFSLPAFVGVVHGGSRAVLAGVVASAFLLLPYYMKTVKSL